MTKRQSEPGVHLLLTVTKETGEMAAKLAKRLKIRRGSLNAIVYSAGLQIVNRLALDETGAAEMAAQISRDGKAGSKRGQVRKVKAK